MICRDGTRRGQPPVVEGLGVRTGVRASTCSTHVAADLHYYSLLRPLSELAVARQFAEVRPLRRAFLQLQPQLPHPGRAPGAAAGAGSARSATSCSWRWRRSCRKPRLVGIFGRNLLDDAGAGRRLRRAAGIPGPQAVRMRGRGPRVARRDGRAGAAARNGARTRWSSASPARSCRSSTRTPCASTPLLALGRRAPHSRRSCGSVCVRISQLERPAVVALCGAGAAKAAPPIARSARALPALPLTLFCSEDEAVEARAHRRRGAGRSRPTSTARALAALRRGGQVAGHQPVSREAARSRARRGHAVHRRHRAVVRRTCRRRRHRADTVCVTGTKGKSTTTALLAHLLRARAIAPRWPATSACRCWNCWIAAGARLLGDRTVELPDRATSPRAACVPQVAVVLNLFPEHLDWHGSEARYVDDKLALLTDAKPRIAVLNAARPEPGRAAAAAAATCAGSATRAAGTCAATRCIAATTS